MFDRAYKDLAFVPRWSIVRKVREQSVAEHSWLVVMYVNDICTHLGLGVETTLAAIRCALIHDLDEIISGDFPGPNKRAMVSDMAFWKAGLSGLMTRIFGTRDDWKVEMQDALLVAAIIKVADWLEAAVEGATELQMGNQNFLVHFIHDSGECHKAVDRLGECGADIELLPYLHDAITDALSEARHGQSKGPTLSEEMQPALRRRNALVTAGQLMR